MGVRSLPESSFWKTVVMFAFFSLHKTSPIFVNWFLSNISQLIQYLWVHPIS